MDSLIRQTKRLYIFMALILLVVVAGYLLQRSNDRENVAARVRASSASRAQLCTEVERIKGIIREDKQRQLTSSIKYLKENPQGAPGIPPKLIRQGIRSTKRTLHELRPVPKEQCVSPARQLERISDQTSQQQAPARQRSIPSLPAQKAPEPQRTTQDRGGVQSRLQHSQERAPQQESREQSPTQATPDAPVETKPAAPLPPSEPSTPCADIPANGTVCLPATPKLPTVP